MLVVCSQCRRHHRHGESVCPFCGSTKPAVTRRFGLGFVVAVGVTSSLGCGGESANDGPGVTAGTTSTSDAGGATSNGGSGNGGLVARGGMMTAYGTPPMGGTTAAGGTGTGGVPGSGGMSTAYGTPPQGGAVATGGSGTGGVHATGGMMIPPYGPPPQGGAVATGGGVATGGSVGAAGASTSNGGYECRADTQGVTGWYSRDRLVCEASCTGCVAKCMNVGTRSEGWYSSCQTTSSGCSGPALGLILYTTCG